MIQVGVARLDHKFPQHEVGGRQGDPLDTTKFDAALAVHGP